ncbi:MAG: MBL fold metallo-hydrolase [Candidatus Sumerlaeota bacterium]
MFIKHFFIEAVNETNVYLIGCPVTKQAALVDAGGFESRVLDIIGRRRFNVGHILITHNHYDHTDGLEQYCQALPDAEVLAATDRVNAPNVRQVEDGETLEMGTLNIKALMVPGHTGDSVAWHVSRPTRNVDGERLVAISALFPGDILFAGSVGGTHSEGDQQSEVSGIKEKILSLPQHTAVFPGHGPATTVGVEKKANPFLID